MKRRLTVGGSMGCLVVGVGWWLVQGASPAVGGDPAAGPVIASALLAESAGPGEYKYEGSNKCKKCHLPEHKSWAKMKHASALETLKPGQATEAKSKAKLDPNKDYSTDAACLACHTVGFGKPGGYAVPPAGDEKAAKDVANLAGVGCEACHGPGSEYNKLHEEIMKSKRKYKQDEMYAVGLAKMDQAVCLTCHNEKSPTVDKSKPFDYAKMKDENTHEHIPPKQRE